MNTWRHAAVAVWFLCGLVACSAVKDLFGGGGQQQRLWSALGATATDCAQRPEVIARQQTPLRPDDAARALCGWVRNRTLQQVLNSGSSQGFNLTAVTPPVNWERRATARWETEHERLDRAYDTGKLRLQDWLAKRKKSRQDAALWLERINQMSFDEQLEYAARDADALLLRQKSSERLLLVAPELRARSRWWVELWQ